MSKPHTDSIPLARRVAEKLGVDEALVTSVMATHGVQPGTVPAARRSLQVLRLRIAGTKVGVPDAGAFDRTFSFPTGVVVAVSPNLKGKTSLLEILTLCLRGSARDLQSDVMQWLETIECDVELNGVKLAFRLTIVDGNVATGAVHEVETQSGTMDGPSRPIVEAGGASEYATAVEALMLDRLDLEPIHSALDQVRVQRHGWAAYFTALYPASGGDRVLLGETTMGGLPGRLLGVFLDLPRTAVLTRITTTMTNLKAQSESRKPTSALPRIAELRKSNEQMLEDARTALAALPDDLGSSAFDLAQRVASLAAELAEAERNATELRTAHGEARAARQQDERRFNSLEETRVAALLFHGLDPSICPRCEATVDSARRARELSEHTCAVCASPLQDDEDEEARREAVEEMRDALAASRTAEEAILRALLDADAEIARARAELQHAQEQLAAAGAARATSERLRLEGAIARAQGALDVLSDAEADPETIELDPVVPVLEALQRELDRERRDVAGDLFEELSTEIALLAHDFGIENVTGARVDGAARLRIDKGGSTAFFSSLSAGERLRLRIATVVALLRVGLRLGVASHPGLLMIDSLRAEEVQDADAYALIEALISVAASTPGLQIITTTADEHLAEGRLSEEHILRPIVTGGALW